VQVGDSHLRVLHLWLMHDLVVALLLRLSLVWISGPDHCHRLPAAPGGARHWQLLPAQQLAAGPAPTSSRWATLRS
jgi:hypothetical protein